MHVVAYYSSWKVYSTCKIEDIDPTLFDVLIYAFAGLNTDGTIRVLDDWADIQLQGFKKFNELKARNPRLKTLLAVGGWNEGSTKYSDMVRMPEMRRSFINSCRTFIKSYGFDGIDLDWEYPCRRGGAPEDKKNLTALLKEVRLEFDKRGDIFTMAVAAGVSNMDVYDIPALSKYLDHIHIMAYDFHSHTDGRTGANAPLHSQDSLNVEASVNAWIAKGADPSKLTLGLGAYGHSFTLANPASHGIGAPSTGPGLPGPLSQASGTLFCSEVVKYQQQQGWTKEWSEEQQVPYSYHGNQWVGYDDSQSLRLKVKFAKLKGLSGVMVWSLDMDDPRGELGVKFPLIKAVKDECLC